MGCAPRMHRAQKAQLVLVWQSAHGGKNGGQVERRHEALRIPGAPGEKKIIEVGGNLCVPTNVMKKAGQKHSGARCAGHRAKCM